MPAGQFRGAAGGVRNHQHAILLAGIQMQDRAFFGQGRNLSRVRHGRDGAFGNLGHPLVVAAQLGIEHDVDNLAAGLCVEPGGLNQAFAQIPQLG